MAQRHLLNTNKLSDIVAGANRSMPKLEEMLYLIKSKRTQSYKLLKYNPARKHYNQDKTDIEEIHLVYNDNNTDNEIKIIASFFNKKHIHESDQLQSIFTIERMYKRKFSTINNRLLVLIDNQDSTIYAVVPVAQPLSYKHLRESYPTLYTLSDDDCAELKSNCFPRRRNTYPPVMLLQDFSSNNNSNLFPLSSITVSRQDDPSSNSDLNQLGNPPFKK